jgi:uncharacterized membrane protein
LFLNKRSGKSIFMNESHFRKVVVTGLCLFLLVAGTWGLFSKTVFGSFTTNYLYSTINIVAALLGLYAIKKGKARHYCGILGFAFLLMGILAFVEGFDDIEKWVLNMNQEMAFLNIIFGVVLLFLAIPRYFISYYNKV